MHTCMVSKQRVSINRQTYIQDYSIVHVLSEKLVNCMAHSVSVRVHEQTHLHTLMHINHTWARSDSNCHPNDEDDLIIKSGPACYTTAPHE